MIRYLLGFFLLKIICRPNVVSAGSMTFVAADFSQVAVIRLDLILGKDPFFVMINFFITKP
jgi:hypothetical protein